MVDEKMSDEISGEYNPTLSGKAHLLPDPCFLPVVATWPPPADVRAAPAVALASGDLCPAVVPGMRSRDPEASDGQ